MKTLTALGVLLFILAPVQSTANLTGKWTGTFITSDTTDGSTREQGIEMNLTHTGKELTGTAGPSAERQWPISKGTVVGDKVTFQVQSDGPIISFALTHAKDRLTGEATGEQDGRKLTAKVDAGRAK
jgi:hypothetical protein